MLQKTSYFLCTYGRGENHEPPRFCIDIDVPRELKIAVLWLHHGATIEGAVEATLDCHSKTVCFNQLFGEMGIYSI